MAAAAAPCGSATLVALAPPIAPSPASATPLPAGFYIPVCVEAAPVAICVCGDHLIRGGDDLIVVCSTLKELHDTAEQIKSLVMVPPKKPKTKKKTHRSYDPRSGDDEEEDDDDGA